MAVTQRDISIRLSCALFGLSETCYRYQAKLSDENALIADWLIRVTQNQRNWGFGLCFLYLRNVKGFVWNHKRVYRIYRELELNMRIKPKKRLIRDKPESLKVPTAINEFWSMDFMHDSLWNGKTYRLLNVIDDYKRQVLAIEADSSIPSLRVIRVLNRLKEVRGLPEMIRVDNGPEFISKNLDGWCKENKVKLAFIQPGEPTQNAFIERFNGSLRRELLNAYVFKTISEVQQKTFEWMIDYNQNRPHKALKYESPSTAL